MIALSAHTRTLSDAEYHAHPAWSKSKIIDFLKSRRQCYHWHIARDVPRKEATEAMRGGTLAHLATLEPDKLDSAYVVIPPELLGSHGGKKNVAENTTAAKDFRAQHEAAGKLVIKEAEIQRVHGMARELRRALGMWLDLPGAVIEQTLFWRDYCDLECRLKLDLGYFTPNRAVVIDLKTTANASPWEYRRRVEGGYLWLQDAHYRAGVAKALGIETRAVEFWFVVVESDWPHTCAVYQLSEDDVYSAQVARGRVLHQIHTCIESGDWCEPWEKEPQVLRLRPSAYDC